MEGRSALGKLRDRAFSVSVDSDQLRVADRIAGTPSEKPTTLTISVVQSRWDQDISTNTARAKLQIARAADLGAQVVVFPEAHLTTYDYPYAKSLTAAEIEKALRAVEETCSQHNVYAITGTLQYRSDREKLLNMAHVIAPTGQVVHEYAKIHLGGSVELASCRRGQKISLFEIYGVPSSVIICRDGRHPDLTSLITMAGAEVIYQISNNCDTIEKSWWKDQAGRSSQPLSPRTANFHVCSNAVGFNRAGDQLTLVGQPYFVI